VIGTWKQSQTAGYLHDVDRAKMNFPKLRNRLIAIADREQPDLILIEDKASGISLIQDLQNQTMLPIVPVKADVSKRARAFQSTGQYESGNIYHRRNALWLPDYEHEMLAFDNGAYDDQVDMTTQFINSALKPVEEFIIV